MHTKKQHIVRKTIIVSVSFILGIISTVIAAATYDANIQTRANKMFNTIKSNAGNLAEADQKAYYTLVKLNIESLIQVLTSVHSSLDIELGTISELSDPSILEQISTGSSLASQTNSAAMNSSNTFTVTVNSGILYCGDPSKNDYTTYSPVDKKVIVQKSYCNEKGGKIWIKCNGENTNIKNVDSFQGGEVLSCPITSVQTPGTATSVSSSVQTSTSVNGCNWQYHSVVGPVGALTVNPSTTACTPNTNGTKAVEVTGNRQTVATCTCATANSTTPTPGTVASLKQVTLTVPSGMVACGNPDKNDYTTYSTVDGKVIIQKDYCISEGGYVWVMCGGKATNIKNVDTIKDGEIFSCTTITPQAQATTPTNEDYINTLKVKYPEKYKQFLAGVEPGKIKCDTEIVDGYSLVGGVDFFSTKILPGVKIGDPIYNGNKKVGSMICKRNYTCWMGMWNQSTDLGCEITCNTGLIYNKDIRTCIFDTSILKINNDFSWYSLGNGSEENLVLNVNYPNAAKCSWCGSGVSCSGETKIPFTIQKNISLLENSCDFKAFDQGGIEILNSVGYSTCSRQKEGDKLFCKFSGLGADYIPSRTCKFGEVCNGDRTSTNTQIPVSSVFNNGTTTANQTVQSSSLPDSAQVSINVSRLDWGTIDGGIIPMSLGKIYTAETKKIVIKNIETPYSSNNVNQQGQSIKVAKSIATKSDSPTLVLENGCAGKELKPSESCIIYATFVAGKNNVDYINGELIIDGSFKLVTNGSSKVSIPLSGKVNGFCQGVGYSYNGQLTSKPDGLCKTVELQPGCYASKAFGVVKVLPVCINTIPSSSTIGTWIGNSASPQAALKSESKSNICYMGDGGSLYANANPRQWDVYNCSRKWAVPELANDTSLESTSTSSSTVSSPEFINSRQDTDSGQYHAWSTKNVDRLSWSCTGPAGKTYGNDSEVLNHERYFSSWTSLHQDGWPAGSYTCTWRYSGNGITKSFTEYFALK